MYELSYILQCEIQHALFSLLCSSPVLFLTWITWRRGCRDSHTYLSLFLLCLVSAFTSHFLADTLALGF